MKLWGFDSFSPLFFLYSKSLFMANCRMEDFSILLEPDAWFLAQDNMEYNWTCIGHDCACKCILALHICVCALLIIILLCRVQTFFNHMQRFTSSSYLCMHILHASILLPLLSTVKCHCHFSRDLFFLFSFSG